MKLLYHKFISFIIFLFCLLVPASVVSAAKISAISITGLYSISRAEFLDLFGIRKYDDFNRDDIRRGIKQVFFKGIFNDIKVSIESCESSSDQCLLYIDINEREYIGKITMTRNIIFSEKDIKKLFTLKEGMELRAVTINRAIDTLKKDLSERGFPHSEVNAELISTKKPKKKIINLIIDEGNPLIIKQIHITGEDLGFKEFINIQNGDIYSKVALSEKFNKFKNRLKKEGYFDPVVGPHSYDKYTGRLTIHINPGRKIKVIVEGGTVFFRKTVTDRMPFFENEDISNESIEEASLRIISLYHERGYPNVQVSNIVVEKNNTMEIYFFIFEGNKYSISDISFKGNTINEKILKNILNLKEGESYNPDIVEDDRVNILSLYHAIGFIDVKVKQFKIDLNDKEKTVSIKININQGTQLMIADIKIEGNRNIESETLLSLIGIGNNSPYNEVGISQGKRRIISLYRNKGYINITVKVKKEIAFSGIILHYIIEEGEMYFFGKTIIRGNRKTDYKVFKRVFLHKEGELYNYNLLLTEKRDLYKTGLFNDIDISFEELEDYKKNIIVEVKEADPGIFEFGFGYSDYEGLRGFFDIRYRNLMGMNRQIRFRTDISQLNQKYSLNFIEPWFFNYTIPFHNTLSYEKRTEKNIDTGEVRYRSEKYAIISGVRKGITEKLSANLSYEFSLTKTFDVQPDAILSPEDVGTLALSSIIPSLFLDTRDNPVNPRRGFFNGISLQTATYLLFSESDFLKLSAHINYYRGLTERIIFAYSIRSGISKGMRDTDELPITERFFLGGRTTVRGFPQDGLGPKGEDGTPTGGNAFLMGNVELRTDILKGLGVVTFFDTGGVWIKIKDYDPTDLRYTAGLGVRYMTPVGPLRVDYGHKLDREEGESVGEVHFSIGYAF